MGLVARARWAVALVALGLAVVAVAAPGRLAGQQEAPAEAPPPEVAFEDPYPDVPERPLITAVVLPTSVTPEPSLAQGAESGEATLPARGWLGHGVDQLLMHSMHHARGLAMLGGATLADSLSAFGRHENLDEVASKLGRYFATPLVMGMSVEETEMGRVRVGGWIRFEPRWLPGWVAERLPDELPLRTQRVELAPLELDLRGEADEQYERLVAYVAAAVARASEFAAEPGMAEVVPPLPDWASFLRWVRANLALSANDWRAAQRQMEPVAQRWPEHAAVATTNADIFFTMMIQDVDGITFEALEAVCDDLLAAIDNPESTLSIVQMGTIFAELSARRGTPEDTERVLLRVLEHSPAYLPAWQRLITQVKTTLNHQRYGGDYQVGLDKTLAAVVALREAYPEAWEFRHLHGIVFNLLGQRERALEVYEELNFHELSLHPDETEPLPAGATTVQTIGSFYAYLRQSTEGTRSGLEAYLEMGELSPENAELHRETFDLAGRTLFSRLAQSGPRGNRIGRSNVPDLRGFASADTDGDGLLDSREAYSYFGVLGRGPLQADHSPLTVAANDGLAEVLWRKALLYAALTEREHPFIPRFLDGVMAQRRLAALHGEADLLVRQQLAQTRAVASGEAEPPEECQRGRRLQAALMSWQLAQLMLARASESERAELAERVAASKERARRVFQSQRLMSERVQRAAFAERQGWQLPNPYMRGQRQAASD